METPEMLSDWREARLIFCQSQSSYGMARFENVKVQATREWPLTHWVASERLGLYSVNDGAARERLDMERVAREQLCSYPTKDRAAMELLGSNKLACKLLGSGYIQDEQLGTGYVNHMYTWEGLASSYIEISSG